MATNSQVRLDPLEDVVVLYQTLVRAQALPAGFEEAFSTLAPHISTAVSRQQGTLAMTNNTQAALDLHEWQKRVRDAEKGTEVAQAQFLLAASKPPKKYISSTCSPWNSSRNTSVPDTVNPVTGKLSRTRMRRWCSWRRPQQFRRSEGSQG